MDIRPATRGDAAAGSRLLRRAIRALCSADHNDDPAAIAAWSANKTFTLNVTAPANYVSPDARFRGVSKAMLRRMEADARAAGLTECRLESTVTAHAFYLRAGYVSRDPGDPTSRLMAKPLR